MKKIILSKGTASEIRAAVGVTLADERRAKRARRTVKPAAGKSKVTAQQAANAARKSR